MGMAIRNLTKTKINKDGTEVRTTMADIIKEWSNSAKTKLDEAGIKYIFADDREPYIISFAVLTGDDDYHYDILLEHTFESINPRDDLYLFKSYTKHTLFDKPPVFEYLTLDAFIDRIKECI